MSDKSSFEVGFYAAGSVIVCIVWLVLVISLVSYWWANDEMTAMQVFKSRPWLCGGAFIAKVFAGAFVSKLQKAWTGRS